MLTLKGRGININTIFIIGAVIVAFIIVLYFLLRESSAYNLKNAIKHHRLGEKYSQKGDYEEAKIHYAIAQEYRERALKKGEK